MNKTDRNLYERCVEHATTKDSAIFAHFKSCSEFRYLRNLLHYDIDDVTVKDNCTCPINCVTDNTIIIDNASNWNILLLKEALYIKRILPSLNNDLKASRELFLFA